MKTTLTQILSHRPCGLRPANDGTLTGYLKLKAKLGPAWPRDKPISLLTILDSNELDDTLWCLRAVDGYDREIRLYAVWCAQQVERLNPDPRVKACNDIAERFAKGLVSDKELAAAEAAARAARAAQEAELRRVLGGIEGRP